MKIFRIASESVTTVMSLDQFVGSLSKIKESGVNAVSIRDSVDTRGRNQEKYDIIDSAGLENLYVVEFDDLEEEFENKKGLIFPQSSHIIGILNWAKQQWETNGKPFVVHCTGGVSRSSAVAMLIEQMISNDYRKAWDLALHSPNRKVLEFGEQHLGVEPFSQKVYEENLAYMKKRLEDEDYDPNPFS